jgi:peptide deformylase
VTYQIRTFGDPVLASQALPVADIDGKIVRIVEEMFDTLYDSDSGIGLAAPQVGIQRQIFVWDMDDAPMVVLNPVIVESDGEWVYDEGCLSIPGLYVEMTRPKTVLMKGIDMNGNDVAIEADELEARLFQHELDHLNGVLMFDRMQPEQRKAAIAEYKKLTEQAAGLSAPKRLKAE